MPENASETASPRTDPLLEVRGLSLRRGARVLHGIGFSVGPGEVLSVVGPSGCGKSTLLLALAGFEECSGEIRVDGRTLIGEAPQRRPTSLVFQSPALFERMSVEENVAFGLDDGAIGRKHAHDLVEAAMTRMGIAALAERRPGALSGGQAQRVALARALVHRPRVLLLDEPLAHVGASLAASIRQTLLREIRRLGIAALYVTHDVEEACLVGDRLLLMDSGRILQVGAPRDLYERPGSEEVARLMGIPNVLSCEIEGIPEEGTALVRCGSASFHVPGATGERRPSRTGDDGAQRRGPALLAMPGEAIELLKAGPSAIIGRHAQIIGASFVRGIMVYDLETEFGTLVARDSTPGEPFALGDHVEFEFRGGWVLGPEGAGPRG